MMRACLGLVAVALLALACGGKQDDPRDEVATTLRGFYQSLVTGGDVLAFVADSCNEVDRQLITQRAEEIAAQVREEGFEVELQVDASRLAIEVVDDEHVTVNAEQPEGAVVVRTRINGQSFTTSDSGTGAGLAFVREADKAWRIADCHALADSLEEELPG